MSTCGRVRGACAPPHRQGGGSKVREDAVGSTGLESGHARGPTFSGKLGQRVTRVPKQGGGRPHPRLRAGPRSGCHPHNHSSC